MARNGKHALRKSGAPRVEDARGTGKATYDDWVWWPNDPGRRSKAEKEFMALPPRVRGEMLARIKRFLDGESRFKDVDDLGDGIKELRYRSGSNHFRVLFFVTGKICVGLTCFYKNQQKTEKVDLDRARQRMNSYGE